jgi:hypothetical protein
MVRACEQKSLSWRQLAVGEILKFTSQSFSTSVAMMSHKHKQKVAQKFYKRK